MRYIGIDLAWGAKNTTAAVVLDGAPERGAVLVAVEEALTSDDAIVALITKHDANDGCFVAIDAPLLVPNETGRRPCEADICRGLRLYKAGAHPANRHLLAGADGTVRGERIVTRLEEQGFHHTPYLDGLPTPARAVFEVFPHPAHVALFHLSRILHYKAKPKRSRETQITEFKRYQTLLSVLSTADPPLRLDVWETWLNQSAEVLKPAALKRFEDALDALTCAYVALYRHRFGDERCPVVGDLTHGYIVTPATDAMRIGFGLTPAGQGTKIQA